MTPVKVTAVFLLLAAPSYGELVTRLDGEAVYDTERDITWLANANFPMQERFDFTVTPGVEATPRTVSLAGRMTWDNALLWVAELNASNQLGTDQWRLPSAVSPDGRVNTGARDSELGLLFDQQIPSAPAGTFQNLVNSFYWTSSFFEDTQAWFVNSSVGVPVLTLRSNDSLVLPVVDGDVFAIPEPTAGVLLLAGVLMLGINRRQRT